MRPRVGNLVQYESRLCRVLAERLNNDGVYEYDLECLTRKESYGLLNKSIKTTAEITVGNWHGRLETIPKEWEEFLEAHNKYKGFHWRGSKDFKVMLNNFMRSENKQHGIELLEKTLELIKATHK